MKLFDRLKYHWRAGLAASRWKFARQAPQPGRDAPLALIAAMGDWDYTLKTESMLALGLRLAGWRVAVLLRDRTIRHAEAWLRNAGIEDIFYFSDYHTPTSEAEAAKLKEEIRAAGAEFEQVKSWRFRGCLIGPQILASISRKIFSAGFDVTAPDVRQRIDGQLNACIEYVFTAEKVLSALAPKLLLVNEANYTYFACLVDTAIQRGIKPIQYVQPNREDAMFFWRLDQDTRRMHPSSVSPQTMARMREMPWTARREEEINAIFSARYGGKWYLQNRNQVGVKEKTRAEVCAELQLDPAKPLAVVFSSVLWDANLFYGADLFKDNGEWFVETIRAACANTNINWLIKLHPVNTWKRELEGVTGELAEIKMIREKIGDLPPHVKLLLPDCGISTFSLFQDADYGIIVRGTSGMEMPCFGKPIVTAGTGRYAGRGFTIDSTTREEYLAVLAKLHEVPPLDEETVLLAKKHLYAAFCLRPWVFKSFVVTMRPPKGAGDLDYATFEPAVKSLDEVRANRDLEKLTTWMISGAAPDYVDEELLAS
jgi:hypothetical protein